MEFILSSDGQGHVYLPKKVRQILGKKMRLLPGSYVAVLYPENAKVEKVIANLEIIISDLQLRSKNIAHNQRSHNTDGELGIKED